MISRTAKLVMGAAFCLIAQQSFAQNVTANKTPVNLSQNGAKARIKLDPKILGEKKPWTESAYNGKPKSESLKHLLKQTKEILNSPGLQKLGGMDGGGGFAKLCTEENGQESIELLDLYEARENGLNIDFGPGETFIEKIEYVLTRYEKVSPVRASIYRQMVYDLLSTNTQWAAHKSVLPVINDTSITILPHGCMLIPAAVQRPLDQTKLPNSKFYIFNKDVFFLLDENSKAALILHEVLYFDARTHKKTDSALTRSLVGLLATREVSKMTLNSYESMRLENGLDCRESSVLPVVWSYDRDTDKCSTVTPNKFAFSGTTSALVSVADNSNRKVGYILNFNGKVGRSYAFTPTLAMNY